MGFKIQMSANADILDLEVRIVCIEFDLKQDITNLVNDNKS